MLTKTFDAAIRGYHYYRRYWHPVEEEQLVCSHEEDNAFDQFAIKTCKLNGSIVGHLPRELSRTLNFLMIRDARIFADLKSTNHRRSPLVQGGLEIPCKITIQMSPTRKNTQLLDRLIELVGSVYSEPTTPEIMGSFLVDEIEFEEVVNFEAEETSKPKQKKKTASSKRSYDIRDMFSGKVPKITRTKQDNIQQEKTGLSSNDIVIIED